jgi:hypothetical protein
MIALGVGFGTNPTVVLCSLTLARIHVEFACMFVRHAFRILRDLDPALSIHNLGFVFYTDFTLWINIMTLVLEEVSRLHTNNKSNANI